MFTGFYWKRMFHVEHKSLSKRFTVWFALGLAPATPPTIGIGYAFYLTHTVADRCSKSVFGLAETYPLIWFWSSRSLSINNTAPTVQALHRCLPNSPILSPESFRFFPASQAAPRFTSCFTNGYSLHEDRCESLALASFNFTSGVPATNTERLISSEQTLIYTRIRLLP